MMVRTRLTLHEELCEILGSSNCYFSPPSVLNYPCIKYEREPPSIDYADNVRYFNRQPWMVTIIDANPESEIPSKLEEHFNRYCSKDREYPSDGLRHFVYRLYY